jgi:hypothetical protein
MPQIHRNNHASSEMDGYRAQLAHQRGGEIKNRLHRRGETVVREVSV